jgi:hypothetical protein
MELCRSPQIGLEFTALRFFILDCSDYRSHATQEAAIVGYARWADEDGTPKHRLVVTPRSVSRITYTTLPDAAASMPG